MKIHMQETATKPLHILMVIPFYYPIVAGAEVFAQEVSEELARRGHSVHVLTRGTYSKSGGGLPSNEIHNQVTIHRVMHRWCDGSSKSTQSTVAAAFSVPILAIHTRKLIKQLQPDVIHSHVFPAGVAATLALLGTGIPQIYAEQQAGFKDYHPFLDNAVGYGLQTWVNRNSRAVQATSHAGADFAKTHGAEKAIVIPNGVHLPGNPSSLIWKEGEPLRICTVSRLEYKNGIDLLLTAVHAMQQERPSLQIQVDIIGDGSRRDELNAQSKSLGLQETVTFHGYLAHETIWEHLQKSHFMVRPSRQEGFGIAFLESMASGAITIGTEVGGIPDIIQDGVNGFLATPGRADSLTQKLLSVIDCTDQWDVVRANALRDLTHKFSWARITSDLEALYTESISTA